MAVVSPPPNYINFASFSVVRDDWRERTQDDTRAC